MGSKRFVPVILFIGLLIGGSYYYLCKIKQVCDGKFENLRTDLNGATDSAHENLGPLSFRYNSAEPIVGSDFYKYRESLLNKLGENDTLVINALYYKNETNGTELAAERAEHVKSLLMDHFSIERLQIHTDFDALTQADDQSNLEAVKFSVVSGEGWTDEETVDNNEVEDNTEDDFQNADDGTDEAEPTEVASSDDSNTGNLQLGDETIIYFPKGSIRKRITPESNAFINQAIAQLASNPSLKIYVEGHSDGEGDLEENYQLGRRRAWVIKKMIWDKGVDPMRIITSSKGELAPMNTNESEKDRAYNRRVIVTIK